MSAGESIPNLLRRPGIDSPPLRRLAAAALLAGLAVAFAVRLDGYAIDDVFITYRYADNLAAGRGLVFNPGERVFGTTAPGLALLLGGLRAASGLPVPALGAAVTAVAVAALGLLLLASAAARGRGVEGAVTALLVVASPLVWVHVGGEMVLALALLAGAAVLRRSRPVAAGFAAGVAVLCRPEAALGAALLAGEGLVRERRPPWRLLAPIVALTGAGALAAWWWFGVPWPATLAAKRLQAAWMPDVWPAGTALWPAALRALPAYYGEAGRWALVAGLAGFPLLVRRGGPAERLVALWALALLLAYPLLGVPLYLWYALPVVLALLAGLVHLAGWAARGVVAAYRPAAGRARPLAAAGRAALAVATAAALAAVAVPTAGRDLALLRGDWVPIRFEIYRAAGRWLAAHTAPGETVAAVEIGTVAFHADRPVHDLLGLTSPAALPHVARRDLAASFLAGGPDLFVAYEPHAAMLQAIRGQPWFAAAWRPVAALRHPASPGSLLVYRRRPDAPPPRP